MSITTQIKALLALSGKKQYDLVDALNMSSRQSLSNKFAGDRWSADDLVKIAEETGCTLAFLLPDGGRIVLGGAQEPGPEVHPRGGIGKGARG